MGFGWTSPLPLRLNAGLPEENVTAEQYLRLASDTLAARRTLPFAIVTISRGVGSASPVLESWSCLAPEFPENEPTITGNHPDPIVITFPKGPIDVNEVGHTLNITGFKVTRAGISAALSLEPGASITAPHIVTVDPINSLAFDFTISVYATWNEPELADYGASTEKENCETELTPYAWIWYQELGASIGSAFGLQTTGLVHSRKAAIARALGGCSRAEERLRLQSTPHTAQGPFVEQWADVCGVPFSESDGEDTIRSRTAARFAAQSGQDILEIEEACSELLGDKFVGISTFDVADADGTWPDSYDLGPGLWATTRSKFIVNVDVPAAEYDPKFTNLVNVQLFQMLDVLAPAWTVFDWADPGGFYLGESQLDYDAL